ncbi:MAG: aldehyde ferredoxin oxidoreductase family protein, partial [Chloroflexota bacterium]
MPKSAFIDLSSGKIRIEETDPYDLRLFLGGRGLGAKWLYDLVGPEIEPFSPENVLIFTAGPLAGSAWPTSSRLHVTFKSPLTGAYGYANSGGFFAAELKQTGFDALVISGQAAQPVVLEVFDNDISLRAAPGLWGKQVSETHQALLGADLNPKAGRVACIGPAGENLVRIAAIMNDVSRAAARGGPGAVMGSKNLKAIHVRASRRPQLPPDFREEAKATSRKLKDDPLLEGLRLYGTLVLMDPKNVTGDQPAKNHQMAQVPFISNVNASAFDRYLLRHKGCYACPITCGRQSAVGEGRYTVELEGPEYETTNALGPMCWISTPQAIMYANHLCNEFGLDTISTGVTIAFAMELHEKGLLNDGSLSLEWGDEASLIGLIERIAQRQDIGNLLADGTRLAAQAVGHNAAYYAMQVKGMELPRQEPRFAKGFGLGHATSNRGADHLYAMPAIDLAGNWDVARKIFPAEIVPELMDPANEKYKADMVVYGEHYCAVTDALGICKFSTVEVYSLLPQDVAAGLSAILGQEISAEDLLKAGERIVNLERLYNVRQGMSRADDTLPQRFSREPAPLYDYDLDPETGEMTASPEPIRYGRIHNL